MNRKLQAYTHSYSQSCSNIARIQVMYFMKRKPHLHDSAIGPDKNKLVEIPPGSGNQQMTDRQIQ